MTDLQEIRFEKLEEVESKYDLERVETTTSVTGYPENVRYALIGLSDSMSFEEAEAIASENDMELVMLDKRDGWNFWYRERGGVPGKFNLKECYDSSEYMVLSNDEIDWYFEEEIKNFIKESDSLENEDDIDQMMKTLGNRKEIYAKLLMLEDDELMLVYEDVCHDIVPKESFSHYYDTKHHVIGMKLKPEYYL